MSFKVTDIRQPVKEAGKYFYEVLRINPIVVEIGVLNGDHARVLKHLLMPSMLYLIDPWENNDQAHTRVTKLFEHDSSTVVVPMRSDEAAHHFVNDSVHFVYVDGGHTYEVVKSDLETWWDKIKVGGYLAGHDYNKLFTQIENAPCGVKQAVDEFAEKYNLKLNLCANNQRNFWFIKE